MSTSRIALLIDGENFLFKLSHVIRRSRRQLNDYDFSRIDLTALIRTMINPLYPEGAQIVTRFYAARLHAYDETADKSKTLIADQLKMKEHFEAQGITFVYAGNVRKQGKKDDPVFREKGVDVQIAVDMLLLAADHAVDTIILASSDSDLQPAIAAARARGVKVYYLGFQVQPNQGLIRSVDQPLIVKSTQALTWIPCTKPDVPTATTQPKKSVRKNTPSVRRQRQTSPPRRQSFRQKSKRPVDF